jgi:hypothetical protein
MNDPVQFERDYNTAVDLQRYRESIMHGIYSAIQTSLGVAFATNDISKLLYRYLEPHKTQEGTIRIREFHVPVKVITDACDYLGMDLNVPQSRQDYENASEVLEKVMVCGKSNAELAAFPGYYQPKIIDPAEYEIRALSMAMHTTVVRINIEEKETEDFPIRVPKVLRKLYDAFLIHPDVIEYGNQYRIYNKARKRDIYYFRNNPAVDAFSEELIALIKSKQDAETEAKTNAERIKRQETYLMLKAEFEPETL